MMHEPAAVNSEADATCEALFWSNDRHAVVLFVDTGRGASVTNAIDLLIPFVLKLYLTKQRVPWRNVRFFARDSMGAVDEVVIDTYDGHWDCEANWIPMPSGMRTIEGFRKTAATQGVALNAEHDEAIQQAIDRWHSNLKKAA